MARAESVGPLHASTRMNAAEIARTDLVHMVETDSFPAPADEQASAWLSYPPEHIARWSMLDEVVTHPVKGESPAAPTRSGLRTLDQLLSAPSTPYVVRNLVPARGLTAIYGPPGCGKSFLAMDLGFALAAGRPAWFGRRLAPTSVAYVALEGQGGIPDRVRAWLKHTGELLPANMRVWTDQFSLLDTADTERLAHLIRAELGRGAMTVIDTLSQATPGGDENSSIDMTKAIRNADALGNIVEGPVILVHHSGKDIGRGMRGHTSLLGAVSATIEVTNGSNGWRSFTVRKNKDGPDGESSHFELVPYPVSTDQWGDEVRSCAVRELSSGPPPTPPAITGKHQKAAMAAVRDALVISAAGVVWERAIEVVASALAVASNRRSTVAKETLSALIRNGHLRLTDQGLRLADQ